jgi:sulfatase modifying factor 1
MLMMAASCAAPGETGMASIPGGDYPPFFAKDGRTEKEKFAPVHVEGFLLDRNPVTNREFLAFAVKHPEWRRGSVKRLFADKGYLQHWPDDMSVLPEDMARPVVNVSWFAAEAYCEARGARLPTTDEWEYALYDRGRDRALLQKAMLDWYALPLSGLPRVGGKPNGFGIRDMAGVVWEWTDDFNSFIAPGDSRNSDDKNMFCGGGSLNASDPEDYPAFTRYAFRASIQGGYTEKSLGFRCAKEKK